MFSGSSIIAVNGIVSVYATMAKSRVVDGSMLAAALVQTRWCLSINARQQTVNK